MKYISLISSVILSLGIGASAQVAPCKTPYGKMPKAEKMLVSQEPLSPHYLTGSNAGLNASFTIMGNESTVTWSENFDNGSEGWTLENAEKFSWELKQTTDKKAYSAIDPDDKQSLFIEGSYRYYERGKASVISPAIDVPRNAVFSGYIGYSYNLSKGYCTLTTYISKDGNNWEEVWSCLDDQEVKSWTWHKFSIDLTAYANQQIRIKFVYGNTDAYDDLGYMGDFSIDGLSISGAADIESVSVMTGETVKFADTSTGTPTTWEWDFPGGTPSKSSEQYPQVFYTADGEYDVSLTVSDGSTTSTTTIPAFVKVTGTAPKAAIIPPATFRFDQTRLPMVAPLAKVQYRDASTGYPASWSWTFTGVNAESGEFAYSDDQNPEVNYLFQHQQSALLEVANSHGSSAAVQDVSVEYEGFATNLQPNDALINFDLDGYGEFPGTNKLGITEYAEKFSKPSRPIMVTGAVVYFLKATATEVIDQIADIKVSLNKSDHGLPGEQLEFMSWRVFELETSSGNSIVGTDFQFSKPVMINDEFFIVVSGIPEKNETCTVSFATAKFRDSGNTAYFKQRGEWKAASSYFPAGSNHTSYAIKPYTRHSVMAPLSEESITVSQAAGTATYQIFSYLGYKTPISIDADWCRATGEPNGMTVDEIKIAYDEMPVALSERTAKITLTDGLDNLELTLTQTREGGTVATKESNFAVCPTLFDESITATFPAVTKSIEIISATGATVYRAAVASETQRTIATAELPAGLYIIKISTPTETKTVKVIHK